MPIVTAQDAELSSIKSIIAEEQTQTVFEDTRELAKSAVNMVNAVINDEEPEVNDKETYDNGVKVVPANLLNPISIDIDTYEEELIYSGHNSEEGIEKRIE